MNDLEKYFNENTGHLIHKWKHYFDVYDRHLSRFRDTDVCIVEIGVFQGGSLQMWKYYFGSKAKIIGVDINPGCLSFEEDQISIFIADQDDRQSLRTLANSLPRIDILIDDGGHLPGQQRKTFEELFDKISTNGVYVCEDLHTAYWPDWEGGVGRRGTFIEYSKNFIDQIHAWHSVQPRRLSISKFTRSVRSIHYYDGVVVIEKGTVDAPVDLVTVRHRCQTSSLRRIYITKSSGGLSAKYFAYLGNGTGSKTTPQRPTENRSFPY